MQSLKPEILEYAASVANLQPQHDVEQFVVQHIYPDTVRLLNVLHKAVPIHTLIAISYSGNSDCMKELKALGIRLVSPDHKTMLDVIGRELQSCVRAMESAGKRVLIHEVGGMALSAAHAPGFFSVDTIVAAMEVTKQGVWAAERCAPLLFPQFNIATTYVKKIEGNQVGEAVVASIELIMRGQGIDLAGRKAAVTGFGWIGRGTAVGLRKRNMSVAVHDINPLLALEASIEGFEVVPRFAEVMLMVGCTGKQSIDLDILKQLPNGCVLASGASKNHEIDLAALQAMTKRVTAIHQHVDAYLMEDGRTLYLMNDGYPINFTGPSVADEVVELLFAELIVQVPDALSGEYTAGVHTLSEAREKLLAAEWLRQR